MAHGLDVPHSSIGKDEAKFEFEVAFFGEGLVEAVLKFHLVVGMNATESLAVGSRVGRWFESEDSKVLVRPVDIFPPGNVPGPTSGVAQALPFGQVGLTAAQGFIRPLSFLSGANGRDSEGEIFSQFHVPLECIFIEFAGFRRVERQHTEGFCAAGQRQRQQGSVAVGERAFPPGSEFLLLANVFRPGWFTGPQSRARRALTTLVIGPGCCYARKITVLLPGMGDGQYRFFGVILRVAYPDHAKSAHLDEDPADRLQQPIFVHCAKQGEIALVERLHRGVHWSHSPARRTEGNRVFSFGVLITGIPAPSLSYATTRTAIVSIAG